MAEEVPVEKEDTQPVRPITEDHIPAVKPQGSGCGCWIPALVALFLTVVLVVVGLFLPPVNLYNRLFGVQYTTLSAQANAIAKDGLALAADPAQLGKDFGVALSAVPLNATTTDNRDVAAALAAVPPTLARQSPVYIIETTGIQPEALTLNITLPGQVNPDLLDMYGWDNKTGTWTFIPAHVDTSGAAMIATVKSLPSQVALFQAIPSEQPIVLASVDAVQVLSSDVGQLATIVAPGGMSPTLDGKLTGSLAPGYELNKGYLVLPIIRNFADPRAIDTNTIAAILGNGTLRSEHATQIAGFASSNGVQGVMIDYRDMPAELRDSFSAFISDLGSKMHQQGLKLGVVVPPAANSGGTWDTGAYDWRAIGSAADMVEITLPLDPSAYEPGDDRPVNSMLRWGIGEVSRFKILLGLSALSVREVSGAFTTIGYNDGLAALGDVKIEAQTTEAGTIPPGTEIQAKLNGFQAQAGTDTTIQSPFVDYLGQDGNPVSRVWLTTPEALRFRMDRTIPFGLGGVAFNDLLSDGVANGVLQTILNYKVSIPAAPNASELALHWKIEGANGVVVEATTGLNDPLVTTIEAPDGNYAINVDVVGGEVESPRSGAAVALFAPTVTPTPLPTATPTPIPTATPAPVVQPVAPPANNPPPVQPGAGSIVAGNFEYGGQVTGTNSETAAGAMRRAGMTWMKVQFRYSNGMSPSAAQGPINDAHSRGFKVLLSIPGVPGELGAGGGGYIQQYASFVGGVAGYGPDAIEVWNEMNLDREWPAGQISGATYADMLRQAYQAIKSANGGVMVISGAPAPTGAEGAFPGRVVNDDHFLRDMVAAGALQYMDCLGAHYNEGIVGPTQNGGDPRDNYYTRYFSGMLDTYWSIIGGQKPICWTELGYLTPEGYPPLDPFFGWGQNTTVAQQAAWLAQAASLSSQSGKVRLMIVFNVDFTIYGSDPQAGYAMVRPGGGCPACDALAGAR
jgi:hypothetical protein